MSQLHPIIEKLRQVQASEKKWLLLFSFSLFVAFVLLTWMLICLVDFYWRIDQPWVRVLLSAIPSAVFIYTSWKVLLPSLRFKRNLVEVARALESVNPSFQSNLSLATDFLSSNSGNGSSELRKELIEKAQTSLSSTVLSSQIKTSVPLRAAFFLAVVILLAGAMLIFFPRDSLFAAHRTLTPLTPRSWPSVNKLVFVEAPLQLAIGDQYECVVVDANQRMPTSIALEIDDGQGILKREMRLIEDQALFTISNVSRSFRMRAIGGDCKTDWHHIQVVTAPAIEDLTIDVKPPAYSGLPNKTIGPFEKIWAGSGVSIHATTDKPIVNSVFVIDQSNIENGAIDVQPVQRRATLVKKNELRFPGADVWNMKQTRQFRIELTGEDSLVGGRNRNFRIPVRVDLPAAVDLSFVGSRRVFGESDQIDIRLNAQDDMQIRELSLAIYDGKTERLKIELQLAPTQPQPANSTERHQVGQTIHLDLTKLNNNETEAKFEIRAKAIDRQGNESESNTLNFRIGSELELANLNDNLRKELFSALADLLVKQNQSRNLTGLVLNEEPDEMQDAQKARISDVAKMQQEIEAGLFGRDSALDKCGELLSSQSISNDDEIKRVKSQLNQLKIPARIAATQANEALALASNASVSLACLKHSFLQQELIINRLSEIVGQIDVRTRLKDCRAEIQELIDQETEIRKQCLQLQSESLSGEDLKTRSKRLLVEQNGVSNRLNELSWGLLNDSTQLSSRLLKDLGQRLKAAEIDSKKAAAQISNQQPGLAFKTITQILEKLEAVLNQSDKVSAPDSPVSKDQIDAAKSSMQSIQDQQSKIADRIDEWSKLNTPERKEVMDALQNLQGNLSKFKNENQDVLDDTAKNLLNDSENLLKEILDDLRNGRADEAKLKMRALQNKLGEVENQLDANSKQSERMLRQERLRKLHQEFGRWLASETKIKLSLDAEENPTSDVFDDLAEIQRNMTSSIRRMRNENEELFALAIELEKLGILSETVEAKLQSKALIESRRLVRDMIGQIEAMLATEKKADPKDNQSDGSKSSDQTSSSGDNSQIQISNLEVQLLRQMQQEILAETKRIAELRETNLTARQKAELSKSTLALADRQSELIATMNKYLQSTDENSGKGKKQSDIPEIPDIPDIDKIPDLPEFECGPQPSNVSVSVQENVQEKPKQSDSSNKNKKQEKKTQEKENDENPNIGSLRPFAPKGQKTDDQKEGEDIGEESDPVRNRLENIRAKMESVQKMLIQQKLADENQNVQSEIIEELKFFQTDQQKRNKESSEQKSQKPSKKGDQAATNSDTSSNPKANVSPSDEQNAGIQKRIDEIWGHLPEQIRNNELNIRSEQFLPKYRDLIKAYFKRLAKDPDIR